MAKNNFEEGINADYEIGAEEPAEEVAEFKVKESGEVKQAKKKKRSRKVKAFAILLLIVVVGAAAFLRIGKATVPDSSNALKGQNYSDVVKQFKKAGFVNIDTEAQPDIVIGLLVSDGDVAEVAIDGKTSFDEGDKFSRSAEVIVRYHTYPEDD